MPRTLALLQRLSDHFVALRGEAVEGPAHRSVLHHKEPGRMLEQEESSAEERTQLGVGLLRSLLRQVVATVDHPTAHFLGPPAPDLQDVVVLLKESLAAPQREHRARYAPALPAVFRVVLVVEGGR